MAAMDGRGRPGGRGRPWTAGAGLAAMDGRGWRPGSRSSLSGRRLGSRGGFGGWAVVELVGLVGMFLVVAVVSVNGCSLNICLCAHWVI